MEKELNIDTFGEIMDKFMEDHEVVMLIKLPEGSLEAEVEDNIGLGSVPKFYLMLNGMKTIIDQMMNDLGIDPKEKENLLDNMLDIVKKDILEEE